MDFHSSSDPYYLNFYRSQIMSKPIHETMLNRVNTLPEIGGYFVLYPILAHKHFSNRLEAINCNCDLILAHKLLSNHLAARKYNCDPILAHKHVANPMISIES